MCTPTGVGAATPRVTGAAGVCVALGVIGAADGGAASKLESERRSKSSSRACMCVVHAHSEVWLGLTAVCGAIVRAMRKASVRGAIVRGVGVRCVERACVEGACVERAACDAWSVRAMRGAIVRAICCVER